MHPMDCLGAPQLYSLPRPPISGGSQHGRIRRTGHLVGCVHLRVPCTYLERRSLAELCDFSAVENPSSHDCKLDSRSPQLTTMAVCVSKAAGSVMIGQPPLLIVDDCVVQRQCLAAKLAAAGRFSDIIFAATPAEALDLLRSSGSQLCLLSWDLPGQAALRVAAQIRREFPSVKLVLIGVAPLACSGQHCFQRDRAVLISRDATFEDLYAEVESLVLGNSTTSRRPQENRKWPVSSTEHADGRTGEGEAALTIREMQVLELIAAGKTNKEIAGWLHISLHTVKNHVHNLLEKMDLPSRHTAAQVFRSGRYGLPEG